MEKLYLDTSAVRALSGKIDKIKQQGLCTSVFTIFELLDGCTKNVDQFKKRKNAIQALFDSNIYIFDDVPIDMVARAFPAFLSNYSPSGIDSDNIFKIAREFVNCSSIDKIKYIMDENENWSSYCESYAKIYSYAVEDVKLVGKELTDDFKSSDSQMLRAFDFLSTMEPENRFSSFIDSKENFNLSVFAVSKQLCSFVGREDDIEFHSKVFNSYNGRAFEYISALSTNQMCRMMRGELPGKNDHYDLDHLAYLTDCQVLVTNDKRMADMAKMTGVSTIFSNDFKW